MAKPIDYMLKRWDRFAAFLDDGRICLTNNAAERALRGFALGRKAWLFAGSDRGAERAAAMATLIETAKLNGVDPQAWLADLLARIAPFGHLTHRVALELVAESGAAHHSLLASKLGKKASRNLGAIHGDSPPAPRFNVVAMPNDWAKQARQAARRATSDAPQTETESLYQEYWLALRDVYAASGDRGRFPKAWARMYLPMKIGRSGFQLAPVLLRTEKQIRLELYMHQRNMPPKQAYMGMLAQQQEIEAAYGGRLDWQEFPASGASRIATYLRNADITDRSDWPRQHHWIIDQLSRFRTIFTERVKTLKLDSFGDLDDADEDTTA